MIWGNPWSVHTIFQGYIAGAGSSAYPSTAWRWSAPLWGMKLKPND